MILCTVGSFVSGLHSPGCRTLNSLDSRVSSPFFILRGGNRPRYRDFCQSCHGRLFPDGQTRQFRLPGLSGSLDATQQKFLWLRKNAPCLLNYFRNSLSLGFKAVALLGGWDGQKIVNISISCLSDGVLLRLSPSTSSLAPIDRAQVPPVQRMWEREWRNIPSIL